MSASATLIVISFSSSCSRRSSLPEPGSKQYADLVSAFYVGLAALQSGDDVRAQQKLTLVTQIAPGKPASWANLGLLSVRQGVR
jgi:Tfp pilus assembly protein PilF